MGWLKGVRLAVICFILFVVIDYIWLSLFATSFYREQLADVVGIDYIVKAFPVLMSYVLLSAGFVVLVYPNTFDSPQLAFFYGFVYGVVVYGVYNLTNFALISHWSLSLVFFDMGWGAFLCGIVGLISVSVSNYLS